MLGLVNIILTLLTKINDGDHNKYHMHDTIPSYLLLAFRMMSLFIFVVGIFMTYRGNKKSEPIQNDRINLLEELISEQARRGHVLMPGKREELSSLSIDDLQSIEDFGLVLGEMKSDGALNKILENIKIVSRSS